MPASNALGILISNKQTKVLGLLLQLHPIAFGLSSYILTWDYKCLHVIFIQMQKIAKYSRTLCYETNWRAEYFEHKTDVSKE